MHLTAVLTAAGRGEEGALRRGREEPPASVRKAMPVLRRKRPTGTGRLALAADFSARAHG